MFILYGKDLHDKDCLEYMFAAFYMVQMLYQLKD